ncbi:pyridoxal phosphate-dependent aminotransferase [Patescibacteria group bacterium]
MRETRLPLGGENLFQAIKLKKAEAENRGQKLINLSIGQPIGPALPSAREAASIAVTSIKESMHEYQDNGSPGVRGFAKRFIQAHLKISLEDKDVAYLPIPGIKPMLGLVLLACGENIKVGTTTEPGYPTPADWCRYLKLRQYPLPLNPENSFRFRPNDIRSRTKLLTINYPHNPSGQIANRKWWEEICGYCEDNDIRIFNDDAYYILSHSPDSCALTEVAVDFPNLSWAEAFSASKVIGNGTGWRIGAIVGSPDFVGDITTIKGNTDSGFVAPMAVGVLHSIEHDQAGIAEYRKRYARRLKHIIDILVSHGMELAVWPGAGFFTLWKRPNKAFGEKIRDAKHFNFLMIKQTGLVGVHFDPYIRYAVCEDVEAMTGDISAAFEKARISY